MVKQTAREFFRTQTKGGNVGEEVKSSLSPLAGYSVDGLETFEQLEAAAIKMNKHLANGSDGPSQFRMAAKAPYWAKVVALEVVWLCRSATALAIVGLATRVPRRQPVMEKSC